MAREHTPDSGEPHLALACSGQIEKLRKWPRPPLTGLATAAVKSQVACNMLEPRQHKYTIHYPHCTSPRVHVQHTSPCNSRAVESPLRRASPCGAGGALGQGGEMLPASSSLLPVCRFYVSLTLRGLWVP